MVVFGRKTVSVHGLIMPNLLLRSWFCFAMNLGEIDFTISAQNQRQQAIML